MQCLDNADFVNPTLPAFNERCTSIGFGFGHPATESFTHSMGPRAQTAVFSGPWMGATYPVRYPYGFPSYEPGAVAHCFANESNSRTASLGGTTDHEAQTYIRILEEHTSEDPNQTDHPVSMIHHLDHHHGL
jgi:hypothetical protein